MIFASTLQFKIVLFFKIGYSIHGNENHYQLGGGE